MTYSKPSTNSLKFEQTSRGAAQCMCTVIYALILRETTTMYGDRRLGYLWVIIQTAFNIAVFAGIRYIAGIANQGSLPVIYFLLIGFTFWNIFSGCINKCLSAISANGALLEFPHVHPLDVLLARCIVVITTHIVTALFIVAGGIIAGLEFTINSYSDFIICLGLILLLSISSAIFIAALNVFYPSVGKIVPYLLRIMFFVSGVFFSISRFPSHWKTYLECNPLLNIIENMRGSVSNVFSYTSETRYFGVLCLSLGFMFFGLLLEQSSHRKFEL